MFNRRKSSLDLQIRPEEISGVNEFLKAVLGTVSSVVFHAQIVPLEKVFFVQEVTSSQQVLASTESLYVKDYFLHKWKDHNIRVASRYDCSGGDTLVPTCEIND